MTGRGDIWLRRPHDVGTIVAAVLDGLEWQRRIDRDLVPDELFGLAVRWLLLGIDSEEVPIPPSPGYRDGSAKER